MLIWYTLLSLAKGIENTDLVLVSNPLLPTLSLLADGVVSLTEVDDFIKLRVWDANLRGYQIYSDRWSLMAQIDYTQVNQMWKTTHVGCKVGPRLSFQNSGFEGWSVTGYGLIGYTTAKASRYPLSKWAVVGAGSEVGRSFIWNNFVLDLGLGLYTTRNLLYRTSADSLKGSEAPPGLTAVPSLHTGIGYAF